MNNLKSNSISEGFKLTQRADLCLFPVLELCSIHYACILRSNVEERIMEITFCILILKSLLIYIFPTLQRSPYTFLNTVNTHQLH